MTLRADDPRLPPGLERDLRDAGGFEPRAADRRELLRLYTFRLDRFRRSGVPRCEGLAGFVAALERREEDEVLVASFEIGTVRWFLLLSEAGASVAAAIRIDQPSAPRLTQEQIARGESGLPDRESLLEEVAREILAVRSGGITRVAIDGVDGAGKTTFADELAATLGDGGPRPVIRASVDDFHRPQAQRYARGRDSPEGFFLDSYDYDALRERLLDPLGPGGSRRYRRRAFDLRADSPADPEFEVAPEDAILILDGIFLHRDELARLWDFSVFLDVPFEVSAARNLARGDRLSDRYVEGQRLYLAACDPAHRATRVIDNSLEGV